MAGRRHAARSQALAEPELEILYRNAPVGMCVLDLELRFVRVNERFAELHGRTVGEVLGRPLADITHEAIREETRRAAEELLATGEPIVDLELNAPRAEDPGGERWWLVNGRALIESGRNVGIAVVVQDLTARKKSEMEASRRLEELESLYRSTPVGLAYLDRDLRYVRVNERLAKLNGLSVREHLGRRLRDIDPDAASTVEPLVQRIVETGISIHHFESTARPATDSVPHAYVLDLEPVKDAQGVVQGVVAAIHDVTKLKSAESAARARLEELESLYRNAPVGLGLIDLDLRFVRVNARLARFTGLAAGAHAGRPLEEVVPEEGLWVVQAVARVIDTGEAARDIEVRGSAARSLRDRRSIRIDLEPATSEDGSVTGVIAVVHDVTDLRRAEEEASEKRALADAQLLELEAVYSLAPVGLALLDENLRFVRVNDRLAALQGQPVHEHIGRSVSELGSLWRELLPALETVLETGSPVRDQQVAVGSAVWRFDHRPVKASDGSVSTIVTCAQEIPAG